MEERDRLPLIKAFEEMRDAYEKQHHRPYERYLISKYGLFGTSFTDKIKKELVLTIRDMNTTPEILFLGHKKTPLTRKCIELTLERLNRENMSRKVWEEKDIVCGKFLSRIGNPLNRTIAFKIIWDHGDETTTFENRYGLCNFLTDGWLHFVGTKQDLVDYLNKDERGFRQLTKPEVLRMIQDSNQGFTEDF